MSLRRRLGRLEERLGPPPEPEPPLSPEEVDAELEARLQEWIGAETYNRGVFDTDPEFRPAWSRYHRLWEVHTRGYSPLQAVWLPREGPEFEAARRQVVCVMVRVLEQQPEPLRSVGVLLASSVPAGPVPSGQAAGA
jgi:hypothetical protein